MLAPVGLDSNGASAERAMPADDSCGDLRGAFSYPLSGSVVCCSQLTRLYCLAHLVVVYILLLQPRLPDIPPAAELVDATER